jgi:hypothetical protein
MTFSKEVELVKKDTRDAIDFILSNYPENIRFVIGRNDFNSIALYIKTGSFDTMIMMYGYLFTLSLLEYFIRIEFYEKCKEIIDCIDRMNTLLNDCIIPKKLK